MLRLPTFDAGLIMSNKVRTSVSVDKELLQWLDKQIKRRKFANRSHGIAYCIQLAIEEEK